MKITIGDYLIKRLKELGIRHLIGVPGDFNLQFLEQVRATDGLDFVGASNELNAAYAADGYAREHGISALCVTYGVGDLGALPGVAGSAAEMIPVIMISGAPPLYATKHNIPVHHSLADGDFSNIMNCFEEFTADRTMLTQENAQEEIDRMIRTALRTRRPVTIHVPSNLSYLEIDADDTPLADIAHESDGERLDAATKAITDHFSWAKQPAVLIDMPVDRLGIAVDLLSFIEKTQTPFASLSTGKAILNESHPLYLGSYGGDSSDEGVQERIENADFLLTVAPRFIEGNSGGYSADLPEDDTIWLARNHTFVGEEAFEGVAVKDVLQRVTEQLPKKQEAPEKKADRPKQEKPDADAKIRQENFWERMQSFLQKGDRVFAETGTSSQGIGSIRLPDDVSYVASHVWGAIGYTLPALYGSLLANPDRRQVLFIGDGSFQVTAQALSRILYEEQNPVIFVINNDGYTIERYIMGMQADYNDIPAWTYHKLPELFSDNSKMLTFDVHTHGDLEDALEKAAGATHGVLIEVHMHREDAPEALKEFGPMTAEFNYGPRGPENEETETEWEEQA